MHIPQPAITAFDRHPAYIIFRLDDIIRTCKCSYFSNYFINHSESIFLKIFSLSTKVLASFIFQSTHQLCSGRPVILSLLLCCIFPST
ncbi:hypothetical protein PGT21_030372 [Puccinia graminis f. sp. tritici]|uniref:Uncharacterized protein n=1 Tax=Puccinia graminis f. sp. tritici TaxID=56615 RepID=A0A5B0M4X6_PUCGR|nr:hypothetical protein PGT21_030372 [Puccinia graminis f. sp. tritici]